MLHRFSLLLLFSLFLLQACASEEVKPEPRVVNPMGLSGAISQEAEMLYSQARILWREKRLAPNAKGEICRDPNKAVELLSKCITLEPSYPEAYIRRAMALNDLKQFDAAFNDCTSALRLQPKAEYYAIRSFSLLNIGRVEGARKDIDKALTANSSSALIWQHAAQISFAEGKKEQGCDELQSACSYGNCAPLQQAQASELCPR